MYAEKLKSIRIICIDLNKNGVAGLSKAKRPQRTAKVSGISSPGSAKRFQNLMREEFQSKQIDDKGNYVILHERLDLGERSNLHVITYSTEKIYISASPYVPVEKFNQIATRIVQLAQQSTKPLEEIRPLSVQRAKNLVAFASGMSLDDPYQRMVIIILIDTSNEIVLREMMKSAKIQGAPLDEGIPQKIKRLKNKGLAIPKEDEIKNLREIRNRVVHYGDIPDKTQAKEVIKIAEAVIESVSKDD